MEEVPTVFETKQEKKERWRSIRIMYFTMFQMSLGFSVALTGVWPYLDKLEGGSYKEAVGWAVGASPLGQLLFAPLAGWWSNRSGRNRPPMVIALTISVVGSVLYALLHLTRPNARNAMLAARFLLGVSSASVAVSRSYLSAATLVAERTRAVAYISLAQVLGFVVGPALQAAATPLGPGPSYQEGPTFRMDMYTAPAWLNALLGLINIVLFLPCCFKERKIAAREAMIVQGKGTESEAMLSWKTDRISCYLLVGAFGVLVFNFVLLETLATSLTMDQFGWNKKEALAYMGALMSAGGLLACVAFALITPLTKLFEERALMVWGGFLLTGLASVLCVPWGPGPPPLAPTPNVTVANVTVRDESVGGCPQMLQPWCEDSRGMWVTQFLIGYIFISFGYPLGVTLIQTIFSKALGPQPQGVWMGVLTGSGCLARALGPVFVSQVYAKRGPTATFACTATITLVTMFFLRLTYNRLLPPSLKAPEQEMQSLKSQLNQNGDGRPEKIKEKDEVMAPLANMDQV